MIYKNGTKLYLKQNKNRWVIIRAYDTLEHGYWISMHNFKEVPENFRTFIYETQLIEYYTPKNLITVLPLP